MKLPKIINHKNLESILRLIETEPYYQPGSRGLNPPEWLQQAVTLEFPLGEICEEPIKTLALTGGNKPIVTGLSKKDGFRAQGLEGKAQVKKDLFMALMNLRDLLPPFRGRILT